MALTLAAACSGEEAPPSSPDAALIDAMVDAPTPPPTLCPTAPRHSGPLVNVVARDGNPQNPAAHFLALNADLDSAARPDRLVVVAFYSIGVPTGTFSLPTRTWVVSACLDRSGGFPACAVELEAVSGTLEITSVSGTLSGALRNVKLVQPRVTPACTTIIDNVSFSATIM